MKHIKKYENYFEYPKYIIPQGKYYWSVKNDEFYLRKQLDKIKCSENNKKNLLNLLDWYDEKILFLGLNRVKTIHATYVDWYELHNNRSYFTNKDYIYKGTISLSKEEIEEVKAEKNAYKYNL
jgi:hypothetical protein